MRLGRDMEYHAVTRHAMKSLVQGMLKEEIELVELDEKIFIATLRDGEMNERNRIWTKDFSQWFVHSSTVLRLKKERRMLINQERNI